MRTTERRSSSPFARAEARSLIKRLETQSPDEIDLELIAAGLDAFIEKRSLEGCEGRLLRTSNRALIVVDPSAYTSKRWRFTVAHEIGHLLLHKSSCVSMLCSAQDLVNYSSSGLEAEANEFAAELLMPTELFKSRCDVTRPSMTHVRSLAERFETSLTATGLRFVECTPEPCAVTYSEAKRIKWWRKNDAFAFSLRSSEALSPDSYAFDVASGRPVEDRMQLTDGAAWSDSSRAEDVDLHEHSIALPARDGVLTLLWHAER